MKEDAYSPNYHYIRYLKVKNDGTILVNKTLDESSSDLTYPTIVLDSNNSIHIIYTRSGDAMWYKKLDNNGALLINKSLGKSGGYTSTDVDSNDNIIGSYKYNDLSAQYHYINVTILDNNGNEIKTYEINRPDPSLIAMSTSVAVDNSDTIHVVWNDDTGGYPNGDLAYVQIENDSVSNVTILKYDTISWPKIDTDSNRSSHICWTNSESQIYYTKLDSNGTTIIDDLAVTTSNSKYCDLAVDQSGNVNIIWSDNRDGNWEIYYSKLDNNGSKLVNDTRLTYDVSDDYLAYWGFPIALNPNDQRVHLTWWRILDNYEAYFKRQIGLDVIINHTLSDDVIIPGAIGEDGIAKIIYKISPSNFSGSVYMDVYNESNTLFYHKDIIYTPIWSTAIWDGTDSKGNYVGPGANYTIKITAVE